MKDDKFELLLGERILYENNYFQYNDHVIPARSCQSTKRGAAVTGRRPPSMNKNQLFLMMYVILNPFMRVEFIEGDQDSAQLSDSRSWNARSWQ